MLGAKRSLVMAKDIKGVYPIPIGETFFQLISHSICLTILKAISKYVKSFPRFGHFPHQFGVLTIGGYETILFASKLSSTYTLIGSKCKST